jgi:hypothetical protein
MQATCNALGSLASMRLQPSHEEGQKKSRKVVASKSECGGRAREAAVSQHDLLIFQHIFVQ